MKDFYLKKLRDRKLKMGPFREASIKLSRLIASEILLQIGSKQKIILIPILRSGMVLLPAFQEIFMDAPIGLIGIQREEKSALPRLYYQNLPSILPNDRILILDPMIATGGSAALALNLLKEAGGKNLTLIGVIAAPEGLALVKKKHPEVDIYTVAIDSGLDDQKFIVPGLGDFGDRYFGTV